MLFYHFWRAACPNISWDSGYGPGWATPWKQRPPARQCVAGTHVMWQRRSRDHRPWKRMWDGMDLGCYKWPGIEHRKLAKNQWTPMNTHHSEISPGWIMGFSHLSWIVGCYCGWTYLMFWPPKLIKDECPDADLLWAIPNPCGCQLMWSYWRLHFATLVALCHWNVGLSKNSVPVVMRW